MAGCRTKRMQRIAESAEFEELVEKLRKNGDQQDSSWLTRHDSREDSRLWLTTPLSVADKGADARDESNYAIAERLIDEASNFAEKLFWPDWTSSVTGETFKGEAYYNGGTRTRSDAWPGGLISTILVRADDAGALRELSRIISSLEYYPVLDDADVSEREWDAAHPSEGYCYRTDDNGLDEDGDECSCPEGQRRLLAVEHKEHPRRFHEAIIPDQQGDRYCDTCSDWVGWLRS